MLEARCLEKRFKKGLWGHTAPVVQDVSLCINPGETIGLIGDSGSGKSTIARMMTRLIRPSKGAVFLDGMDIDAFSNDQMQRFRRSVQMIFQDPNHALNPKKTISWSMREPILAHAIASSPLDADRIIRSLFQETGLSPEIRTRFPSEISGGQA